MDKKSTKFSRVTNKIKILGLAGLMTAATLTAGAQTKKNNQKNPEQKKTTEVKKQKTTRIELKSMQDMQRLFNESLKIIFAELILEEVPMSHLYDDYGRFRGKLNTIGVGSTYLPKNIDKDYNKSDAVWYHIASNQKTFKNTTFSPERMLKAVIGWATRTKTQNPDDKKIITQTPVLQRMFAQLKGCKLSPNEFSALFCACYNAESNITKLLPEIKRNYTDKIKCANLIRTWYTNQKHNKGHIDRCWFEALVWLDCNYFCESMMDMNTYPAGRASSINANKKKTVKFTKQNYQQLSENSKKNFKKVVYKKPVSPRNACIGLDKYFTKSAADTIGYGDINYQAEYDKAINLYQAGDYKKALKGLLDLQKQGVTGPSLSNDLAIVYFQLKQYDNCINMCREALKSDDNQEYAKACFNAGKAYEAKGDYANALKNYKAAKDHFTKYGIADKDNSVDYNKVYDKAIERVTPHLKSQKTVKSTKRVVSKSKTAKPKKAASKSKTKNKKKKSAAFILGAITVANKKRKVKINAIRAKHPLRNGR